MDGALEPFAEQDVCRDCGSTELVENPAVGSIICRDCGLEHVSYMIDYRTEWRTFADKDRPGADDQVRVGAAINPLLSNTGFKTTMKSMDQAMNRASRSGGDSDRKLKEQFRKMEALCDRLNLTTQRVRDRAMEVYKRATDVNLQRFMKSDLLGIACTMYAARLEGRDATRTLREVVLETGLSQKEIARALSKVQDEFKNVPNLSLTNSVQEHPIVSIARNYATYLDLSQEVKNIIEKVAEIALPTYMEGGGGEGGVVGGRRGGGGGGGEGGGGGGGGVGGAPAPPPPASSLRQGEKGSYRDNLHRAWEGRSRPTIAAAVVYLVSLLPKSNKKLTPKQIHEISGVKEVTIMQCVKDMYPEIHKLIPNSLVPADEVRRMVDPFGGLITGGTGYLGQFLLQKLGENPEIELHYTYNDPTKPATLSSSNGRVYQGHRVDFRTGDGLEECFAALTPNLAFVIHCAAMSSPAACEQDPDSAYAINSPSHLLTALASYRHATSLEPLLLFLSTDHVYHGDSDSNTESMARPRNVYGKSKKRAEEEIARRWRNGMALRSSMMIGPAPPLLPVSRNLFLQWMSSELMKHKPCDAMAPKTRFFSDEYRTPTYVDDLVATIHFILTTSQAEQCCPRRMLTVHASSFPRVMNVACKERLSRADMARELCSLLGIDPTSAIDPIERKCDESLDFLPLDISMDTTLSRSTLAFEPTPFVQALGHIFPPPF